MWKITDTFRGYENKRDKTKQIPGVLVDGSKNMVSTDGELYTVRNGYTLLGASNSASNRIEGSTEWDTSSGTQRALRSYDDELEVYINSEVTTGSIKSPGTMETVTDSGVDWSNPDNAKASDNSYAQSVITVSGGTGLVMRDNEVIIVKSDGSIGSENKADTSTNWGTSDATATYGDSSDLWSETWTPDDINDSDFGVILRARAQKGSDAMSFNSSERLKATNFGFDIPSDATITGIKVAIEKKTAVSDPVATAFVDHITITVTYTQPTAWLRVLDGWSDVDFQFIEGGAYWDTTEKQDALLFVNGDNNIYYWSGGLATLASVTPNTITKEGTPSWAEARFLANSTRTVRIKDTGGTWREFGYTGGETTTTLTGVTPDPTGFTFATSTNVIQKVRTQSNTPASTDFQNDSIAILNNQVWVGSTKHANVFMSKVDDYTSYSQSSPRLVGEGVEFNLDAPFVGFQVQENNMYISAGKSQWYRIVKELSDDNTAEEVNVERLKSGTGQGALSQNSIGTVKNSIVFLSNETTLDTLGRIENITTPEQKPLSDPIKIDFDFYTWGTTNHIKFFKNNLYITVPSNDLLLVYNIEKRFWETPWTMPAGRLAIINDELHLHSDSVPETYKLFDGFKDNGNPINNIARFSYLNFGTRTLQKSFNEFYNEGYIQTNTTLTRKLFYDYRGVEGIRTEKLKGTDKKVLSLPGPGGIGKSGLGKDKLAGGSDQDDLRKFRWINEESELPFYEMLVEYSTNSADYRWSILAFGPDVDFSDTDNGHIKS